MIKPKQLITLSPPLSHQTPNTMKKLPPTTVWLSLLPLLLLLSVPSPTAGGTTSPTAYEVLQEYNFPVGILPKGVTKYELDRTSGKFKAYLNGSCEFWIKDYYIKYKSTITGVISRNELKKLKGISVRVLVVWLNIVEVSRDDGNLDFSVGIVAANFGVRNFLESPQCGCGFNCTNNEEADVEDQRKMRNEGFLNRFVFSY